MIPDNMLDDLKKGKEKRFDKIKHNKQQFPHDPTSLDDCLKCQCDDREAWSQAELAKLTGNETRNGIDADLKVPHIFKLSKVRVIRGRFDDIIGIESHFSF